MDLLGSEYGWPKQQILHDTYPEEFFLLSRQIKMRRLDEYIMQTSIATQADKAPEDAKEFLEDLLSQRRFFRGEDKVSETLDLAGFEAFRKQTMEQSKLIKAK